MDPSGNAQNNNGRLFLNFQNDSRFTTHDPRMYPTTPSTFPNPIYQGQGQQQSQQQLPSHQASLAPPAHQAYGTAGQYSGQPQAPQQPGYAVSSSSSSNAQYQQPSNYFPQQAANSQTQYGQAVFQRAPGAAGDATNGLVHQFSHQNLGGRASPYAARQPSPSQRPRTAGASGQPQNFSYLNAPMPHQVQQPVTSDFQTPPERVPERFGGSVVSNQKRCAQLSEAFFKDSVKRARDRNVRQKEVESKMADPSLTPSRREQLWLNSGKQEGKYLRFLRTRDKPDNYTTIKIIGKGAFGEVKLVQKKQDNKIYAMKSLIKTEMFKKDQLAHVRAERDILAESDSPWVVKLFTTFQDADFLYMLMEFLPGGDLMTMLIKYEIFSEDITRFYIAEIVLAIEAVHKLGFIHRDIKPDNILLDRGGHVKLTDFGLSTGFHRLHDNSYYQQLLQRNVTKSSNRHSVSLDQINLTVSNRSAINDWRKSRRVMAYSTVGTPDYIAPEIFTGHGYSFDCDWWSLGTIMFECQVGWPPFCAEESHDTYRKIVNWRQTLYFPDDIRLGADAENLIRSLICNSENRLGRSSADEIKNHRFFRGVKFEDLRKIRAPFEPKLSSNVDTTYFPIDEIDQTDNATLLARAAANRDPINEVPEMSLPFLGYTFKRFENNYR